MQILKINQPAFSSQEAGRQKKKNFNTVKITGYASLGFGLASIAAAANKKVKMHKTLGWSSAVFALAHTGIIEWYHYQRKKNNTVR